MIEKLNQILYRLSKVEVNYQSSEEATKQGTVLPILNELGWDVFNTDEVVPEYQVGNGRVDYCLRIAEKQSVFVEVKRFSEDLERHEKQLLEYSFNMGVEIAALTNGFIWWLYLPLVKGTWQQRKFFTIDIKQQLPDLVSKHFFEYLSKEEMKTGRAVDRAKKVQESKEKEALIGQTIPKAWSLLLREPDEQLLELFSNKVESICGYRPEPQSLVSYLSGKTQDLTPRILQDLKQTKSQESQINQPRANYSVSSSGRHKGIVIRINGNEFEANSVSELYQKVLTFLVDNMIIRKLDPFIPYSTSKKRYLISREPYHPRNNEFFVPVEYQGYFMEAHKDYRNAVHSLSGFLKLGGISLEVISNNPNGENR